MVPYLDKTKFIERYGTGVPEDKIDELLNRASRDIDTLSYNRIRGIGFGHLTDFQKEIIEEVAGELALFKHDNAEFLESPLSEYSLNGASVKLSSSEKVMVEKGVTISRSLYALLCQTGLCCKAI